MSLFRAYDIRGRVESELNADMAWRIGKAFVTLLRRRYETSTPRILVGRDNRVHGRVLMNAFIKGLVDHGAQVRAIDEGSPTPMISLWTVLGKYDGGANVTASHNPSEYNGFKLMARDAGSVAGDDLRNLEAMIAAHDFDPEIPGTCENISIARACLEKISSLVTLKRPLSLVIDAGNGIAGKYYPELFERLGCNVHRLYCDQDGTFPNHEPDPSREENLSELKKMVKKTKSDLGLAFDGDGDRVAVVDEKGMYHDANETFVLLIQDMLERNPGEKVVYTISCSMMVTDAIKKFSGKGMVTPVGHSFVEMSMRKKKAVLGGEQSGHFFMAENYYPFDDALFAAARLVELFSRKPQEVSSWYTAQAKYYSKPEFRPFCDDEKKFKMVEKVTKALAKKYPVSILDGVRVDIEKRGWLGIRASNTSPCLSICMEGRTQKDLEEIYEMAKALLRKQDIVI